MRTSLIFLTVLAALVSTASAVPAPANIQKCSVKAGRTAGTDSLSFSGVLGATAQDVQGAYEIVVTVGSPDMVVPLTAFFAVDQNTFKNGRYTSPRVKVGKGEPSTSFKYDTKNGKVSFTGKNLDLKGLSCPMTIRIEFLPAGTYVAEATLNEDIVNGKQPMPMQFMMGIANMLRVDKVTFRFGKTDGSDTLSVRGAFAVEDVAEFQNGLAGNGTLAVILGGDVFMVQVGKLAKFDPAKCTFTINLKGLRITGYGPVDFELEGFGTDLLSADKIDLGPKRAYNLEELRRYNMWVDYTYASKYSIKVPGWSYKGDEGIIVNTGTYTDAEYGNRPAYYNHSRTDDGLEWEELDWWTGSNGEVMVKRWIDVTEWYSLVVTSDVGGMQAAPELLRVGQSFTNTGGFVGTLTLPDEDYHIEVSNLHGTVKTTCKVVKHETVTVPEGTFTAARVEQTYDMSGTMDLDIHDFEYDEWISTTGTMTLKIKDTWWGVPGVGIVKAKNTETVKLTAKGAGSITVSSTNEDVLTGYDD